MARIRTVKPEMAGDEDLASCSIEAQLLAVRLLCHSDDEGFFKANPMLVKAACFPLQDFDSQRIDGMLNELSDVGYLRLATGVDSKLYGEIRKFTTHQRINRATASRIRGLLQLTESSVSPHPQLTAGKEGKGKERKGRSTNVDMSETSVPDKVVGKKKAGGKKGEPKKISPCPHQKIISLANAILIPAGMPRTLPNRWKGSAGQKALTARWQEDEAHQSLDWWEQFFRVCTTNPHWCGENNRGWTANLTWFVKRENFDKVIQRWDSQGGRG